MKKTLHLRQGELDTISTAFFVAGLFSWIPGICADRFGTRLALPLGGFLGATSLVGYWAVARQFLHVPHEWLVPLLSLLGISVFLSNALVTGSVFKVIVANCGPGTKGSAVGVAKGYVGLGAGAYACLFEAIRQEGQSDLDFLLMAAVFAVVIVAIPGLIILPTPHQIATTSVQDHATALHFRVLYGSLCAMALLIVGNSLLQLLEGATPPTDLTPPYTNPGHYGTAFLLMTVWLGPITSLLYLPRRDISEVEMTRVSTSTTATHVAVLDGNDRDHKKGTVSVARNLQKQNHSEGVVDVEELDPHEDHLSPLNDDISPSIAEEERLPLHSSMPMATIAPHELPLEEKNLFQMLQTPTAWYMLWTTTILVGSGTVETNNMGQMVEALQFPEAVTPASMAFFSVAQSIARVATGTISEMIQNWNISIAGIYDGAVPRPVFLMIASILCFIAHFILALARNQFMFVMGVALAGAAFGMAWPLMVLVTGEVFGTKHVGANYLFFDGFSSAAGTYFLSKVVAQKVYEEHIDPSTAPDPNTCIGLDCFQKTHIMICALAITCVLTSLGTLYTSRHIYYNGSQP